MSEIDWSRLRSLTAREIINALNRDGFYLRNQAGSHQRHQHPDGRRVTVSFHHPGNTFRPKTLRSIIGQAGWDEDDLRRLKLLSSEVRLNAALTSVGPNMTQLILRDDERAYLTYVARRIDYEVNLLSEGQQDMLATVQHVLQLVELAERILGEDELPGWLEAATRAPELSQLSCF